MAVKVKICGTTSYEDAALALDHGADAIGFIFYDKSPRYIAPSVAQDISRRLPPYTVKVGVFVNEFNVEVLRNTAVMGGLTVIQLHGSEGPEYCQALRDWPVVKAFRVGDEFTASHCRDFPVSAVLLDAYDPETYGGTGRLFDWGKAIEAKQYGRVILAGGLRPDNVGSAIKTVKPYAVDVCSGVESKPGQKDRALMRLFFEAVEKARQETAQTTGSLSNQMGEWFQA